MSRKTAKRPRAVKEPKEGTDTSVRDFLYALAERGKQIPAEVRAKIPRDAARNLDHYLYGHTKID